MFLYFRKLNFLTLRLKTFLYFLKKVFLIFWEMELSSLKLKNSINIKNYIFSKKNLSYILGVTLQSQA